jgi:sporulation protein YlmC with PRC-barrel domain
MSTYNENQLVALRDTDEIVLDPDQDIRGRKVQDSGGQDLGKVHDLLVDQAEGKVRAMVVQHGHLLEKTTSVIPVDAITRITPDEVQIDQDKRAVEGSAAYDPTLVYDTVYYTDVYDYYGYAPYWVDGYAYPVYPYYV